MEPLEYFGFFANFDADFDTNNGSFDSEIEPESDTDSDMPDLEAMAEDNLTRYTDTDSVPNVESVLFSAGQTTGQDNCRPACICLGERDIVL